MWGNRHRVDRWIERSLLRAERAESTLTSLTARTGSRRPGEGNVVRKGLRKAVVAAAGVMAVIGSSAAPTSARSASAVRSPAVAAAKVDWSTDGFDLQRTGE